MSFGASLIHAVYRLSGVKKLYSLPEDELLKAIEKANRGRGFFLPADHKAYYEKKMIGDFPCLIVRAAEMPAKRAILFFFGGGAFMAKCEKLMRHGQDDVPEYMLAPSRGDYTGVGDIHFYYSTDEVLYGALPEFRAACERANVPYTVTARPGVLLFLVCAVGIRNGAVGMVHLYEPKVQERCISLGLTTREKIKRNQATFKIVCLPGYIAYVLVFVYAVNGARGFAAGFWQLLVILSVMNLIDRFLIDGCWVGHTKAWTIPGTEDLKPYIPAEGKRKKWLFGTLGMAVIAAVLAGIMCIFVR